MDLGFKNKVVIITGASLGIGAETALLFAQEGARVVLIDLDEQNGEGVLEKITSLGGTAEFLRVDVALEDEVKAGIQFVGDRFGQIDVLVNNAGIYRKGDVLSFSEEDFSRVLSVNVKGVLFCSKYAAFQMKRRNHGVIVNVASEAGIVGIKNQVIYNLSKAAVISITKSCAVDLAPYGIRVNCVCPGTTSTPLVEKALEKESNPAAVRKELERSRPLNRLGNPSEIASAILFLASDMISYATGAVLSVDGGYTAW
ncbi:MAG: SDR family NAD(P)-dependent oxidoreductase [Candidatus Caldatribacteriaceae bacterium]